MITIKAPAKINLFLDVLGKRRDGYHDIRSLVLPVSLYDTLRFEPRRKGIAASIAAECRFKGIPWSFSMGSRENNLVVRAAELLRKHTGCRKGAAISLTKRIPIGAGLGGGSSDAAAVLTGLNLLWQTGLSTFELMEIGARIGCDVPALIHGGANLMEGRGEAITPIEGINGGQILILLIYPGFAISTCDIYQRHDRRAPAARRSPPAPGIKFRRVFEGIKQNSAGLIGRGLFNALQETVFSKYPLLEIIKNRLEKAGAEHVQLTGSGSTVFVLLNERSEGDKLARLIRRQIESPLWTKVVQTIGKSSRLMPAATG
ncbi:MAG: 4-(cytidine 5'-diphospho)-2-C-methyl-D-erythritol kinase [Kiritimatiellia bacterium]